VSKVEFFLLLIPVFAMFPFLILYRFQGKKNIFSFDLVQFLYNFIFTPLIFIWLKTVLYATLVSSELYHLTSKQLFLADSVFSLVMLYVYAFYTMHFLTKTFRLKNADPLYNLFTHSEYIHLWLSHIVMFAGTLLIFTALSLVNLFFPLKLFFSTPLFFLILLVGFVLGLAFYFVILISAVEQKKRLTLTRLVKLIVGLCFSVQLLGYFLFDPNLESKHVVYWGFLMFFTGIVLLTALDYRSSKTKKFLRIIFDKMKHQHWGENILSFNHKQKG